MSKTVTPAALTDEERAAIIDAVREFAQSRLAPNALDWDRRKHFPRDVLAEAGFDPNVVTLVAHAAGDPTAKQLALRPEVKLIDFFDLGRPNRWKIHKDVLNLVEVFHTIVGGRERYAKQPRVVKDIVRGLKDSLILKRFQSAGDIQQHLENLTWD